MAKERAAYIADTLKAERGDLSQLDHDVIASLAANDILTENIEEEIESGRTFGERAADAIASFAAAGPSSSRSSSSS